MVVETFVSGRVDVGALNAGAEKAQGRESSRDRVHATHEAALHPDGIGREGKPNSCDARRRSGLGLIRDKPVKRVRLVKEKVESLALQRVQEIRTERLIIH